MPEGARQRNRRLDMEQVDIGRLAEPRHVLRKMAHGAQRTRRRIDRQQDSHTHDVSPYIQRHRRITPINP
jgi:hypothetical protein